MRTSANSVARTVLRDGDWHPFHEVFEAIRVITTPEDAMHECRFAKRESGNVEQDVMFGARQRVIRTMAKLKFHGQVEHRGVGNLSEYKLTSKGLEVLGRQRKESLNGIG